MRVNSATQSQASEEFEVQEPVRPPQNDQAPAQDVFAPAAAPPLQLTIETPQMEAPAGTVTVRVGDLQPGASAVEQVTDSRGSSGSESRDPSSFIAAAEARYARTEAAWADQLRRASSDVGASGFGFSGFGGGSFFINDNNSIYYPNALGLGTVWFSDEPAVSDPGQFINLDSHVLDDVNTTLDALSAVPGGNEQDALYAAAQLAAQDDPLSTTGHNIYPTPVDDDGNLNPGSSPLPNYDFVDLIFSNRPSREMYDHWATEAAARVPLISGDVPQNVYDTGLLATVKVAALVGGDSAASPGSGVLALDDQGRVVLFAANHLLPQDKDERLFQSDRLGPIAEGSIELTVTTGEGRVAVVPLVNTVSSMAVNSTGSFTYRGANANDVSNDGLGIILDAETVSRLLTNEQVRALPTLSASAPARGESLYQFGFPEFMQPSGTPLNTDLRLLSGSVVVNGEPVNNGTLKTNLTVSENNPPQAQGSSGGPVFQQNRDGTVSVAGIASTARANRENPDQSTIYFARIAPSEQSGFVFPRP